MIPSPGLPNLHDSQRLKQVDQKTQNPMPYLLQAKKSVLGKLFIKWNFLKSAKRPKTQEQEEGWREML